MALGNTAFSSVDGMLFDKKKTKLIYVPRGKKGKVKIPFGVTSVADCAFYDCIGLTI